MKLSIIILTCDKDKDNVQNVITQIRNNAKIDDYEILVADNTTKGIESCFAKVLTMGGNIRQAGARYTSAIYAKGDYLWFVDADDEILDVPDITTSADLIIFDYKENNKKMIADKDFYCKKQISLWNKWMKKDVYLRECKPLENRKISFFEDGLACALLDRANLTVQKENICIYNWKPSLSGKKYFENSNDFILWCGNYIDAIAVFYNYFTDEQRTHYLGTDWRAMIERPVISKALLTIANNSDWQGTLKSIFDYLSSIKNIKDLYEAVARSTAIPIDDILDIRYELAKTYNTGGLIPFKLEDTTPAKSILHCIGSDRWQVYRRYKLNDYLQEQFSDMVVVKDFENGDFLKNRYRAVIISFHPTKDINVIIKYCYLNNVPLFYDRTDNWSAFEKKELERNETLLIQNAKTVFCSARFLQEDAKKRGAKDTRLITNGCDIREFTALPKYERKTAIYIGRTKSKLDIGLIEKLAKENPTWDFIFYISTDLGVTGDNIKVYDIVDEDTLFDITRKCHIGLIPFIKSEWTRGMLPLKLFNYANAHIPTAYSNCPECDYYRDHFSVIFDLNSIDGYTGKKWTLEENTRVQRDRGL